jgi:hypothetical protein
MENNIATIQHNDETCIKVKQAATQAIESVISNPRRLLRIALTSLFASSRKHPGKFQALYYNISSPYLTMEQILSQLSIGQDVNKYIYNENKDEKFLLDEAEQTYNSIVDGIANQCINGIVTNDTELSWTPSLSPLLQASNVQGTTIGNREIFDTKDLTQVNFVYKDITFQVCPSPKVTNGRSTTSYEMGDWLSDSEYEQHQDQQE